jgi:hypothetical protein
VSAKLFLLLAAASQPPPARPPAPAPPPAQARDEAEEGDEPAPDPGEGEEIVVTGQRERGAVDTDIPPETQLNARELRALGASSIAELLSALAPQTRSGRGRGGEGPVTLLNGRRISSFAEIRDIPPEAIERVDILPEEVALRYGYSADQRVVNFVLRPRFRAVTTELAGGFATDGGRENGEADFNLLRIGRNGRWSVDAEIQREAALLESERDIVDAGTSRDPAVASLAQFRTLMPATEGFTVNGILNRSLLGNVSATLNARFDARTSRSRFGLPSLLLEVPAGSPFSRSPASETLFRFAPAAGPLGRESDSRNAHLGIALNGDLRPWRWSFTGNYDRNRSETRTDTGLDPAPIQALILAGDRSFDPFGPIEAGLLAARPGDRSDSLNRIANGELVVSGPLAGLPAGEVSATFKAGADTRSLHSRTLRGGSVQERELGRDRLNGQASLDVPITSRRRGFLEAVGNLSANLNAAFEELSDFGTLRTLGAGLSWSPIEPLSLIASVTDEDGAPAVQQLGDPALLTPNVRVFDFVRGETAEISLLSGGNPELVADNRRVLKLGATLRPLKGEDLSIVANYTDNSIRDPIAGFPTATAEIEAAFPERFLRDEDGRLLRVDARPVNFARSQRRELRWGFNFSKPLGPQGQQGRFGPGGPGVRPGAGGAQGGPQGQGAGQPQRPQGSGAQPQRGGARPQGGSAQPQDGQTGGRPQGPGRWGGGQGAQGGQRGPGGPGGGGFRGFGGPGFGGGRGGRLQLGLYHNWRFEDSVLIREGGPELDFLDGSAASNRGGRPRHEIELQAGLFKNGFGGFLFGSWQQGTTVRGGPDGLGGTRGDLSFSPTTSLNLRLFANLGQQRKLVREVPFLRGSRVAIAVNNLLGTRPEVRDENGLTPLSYQPAYLDPLGRTVRISLRKLFF